MEIRATVVSQAETIQQIRRDLHRIPEPAFTEATTHAYLYAFLQRLQPDVLVRLAGTGLKAVFLSKSSTQTIAFRADMDGLPIQEQDHSSFTSIHPGMMHACGHDAHMAISLVTAKLISQMRDRLKKTLYFYFSRERKAPAAPVV